MFTFLVTLILITAVLLILAVLVQNSQKEGLGSPLGDTGASQLIGVKRTSDLLERVTWGLIMALFVLTLSTSLFLGDAGGQQALPQSPNIERAQERSTLPDLVPQADPAPAEEPLQENNQD